MTPKEAIEQLNGAQIVLVNREEADFNTAVILAINALEKQIPKKPILKNGETLVHLNKGDKPHEWQMNKWQDWVCPVCGWFVGQRYNASQAHPHDQRKSKFCNECGQAIDWGEEE